MSVTVTQSSVTDVTRANPVQEAIYLKGNESTDGSIRIIPDTSLGTQAEFQLRESGVWNDTGIQIAAATIYLGRDLRISSAGEWIYTRDIEEGIRALAPHIEFTDAAGTAPYAHVPILSPLIEDVIVQGDDSGQRVIDSDGWQFAPVNVFDNLTSDFSYRFYADATANMIITVRNQSHTGPVFFQHTYPISLLVTGESKFDLDGLVEGSIGQGAYVTLQADAAGGEIYMKTNAAMTLPWLSLSSYALSEESIVTFETGYPKIVIDSVSGNVVTDSVSGEIVWDQ